MDDLDIQALVGKTPAEIELYLRRLGEDAVPTNEMRVILIGNGAAGKSTMVHRLQTGEYKEKLGTTRGWRLPPGYRTSTGGRCN